VIALPPAQGDRLTDRGWQQAKVAAGRLAETGANRIVSSPLRRARETASVLSEELGLPVVELPELRELRESDDFGELSEEDQRLRRWSVWMTEHGDDPDHSYRGAETFNEMVGRVGGVQDWLVSAGEESVLAVTHGIFLRFFLLQVLLGDRFDASMTERLWQLQSVNCGVCSFEHLGEPPPLEGPGPWRCRAWMASEPGP
jgi:broad specificity phosphatase PhoE